MTTRDMWEIWKDMFIPSVPWRMRTPIGIISFKTKRRALAIRDEHRPKFAQPLIDLRNRV